MNKLQSLLAAIDAQEGLAQRHLWLIDLCAWFRGDQRSVPAAVARFEQFLDAVHSQPDVQQRLQAWWRVLAGTVDITHLLADFGFAPRTAFVSELSERLRRKLLPATPETTDASELFMLALPAAFDARWLAALEDSHLSRLSALLGAGNEVELAQWHRLVLDAITYCTIQIQAAGFSSELRQRMSADALASRPFHALSTDVQMLRDEVLRRSRDDDALNAAAQNLRERLECCRQATASVYTHLDENGISVGMVFRLRQLRQRVLRIRELMDCVLADAPAPSAARLLSHLVAVGQERRSVRALIAANSSVLAAKVAERSAETGEHYITRDRPAYFSMLRKAAGGGAVTAVTTLLKFAILAVTLSAFWSGFWVGAMYAACFVVIQLLHFTLATKQPAMTAPAMAAKLKDLGDSRAIEDFVDEVAHLVRSQVAAVLGNVLTVFPAVLLLDALIRALSGHPMISAEAAHHALEAQTLWGPTLLFAAFTGCLLFSASIIAGWVENWFVLHRLDSAIRYNPRITALVGAGRAERWAHFMRVNISGFAANISLGFMMGLVPAFAAFFGLGLDVRHVTLSTGQLAAASASLGLGLLHEPIFWWCVLTMPLIGVLNVSVSFYLAFRLALRAHSVSDADRSRIRARIWRRWRRQPLSFFLP
ncbi:MAG: site-specific recombinase [Burkholderiaceae bacterium]|nr:site-specific recombinase [Burkholderiaceae bacterium]